MQDYQLRLQGSWCGPAGALLSGTAIKSSAGDGSGGVTVTGSTPLDPQRHTTLFASGQAYTDEQPSLELELDDK